MHRIKNKLARRFVLVVALMLLPIAFLWVGVKCVVEESKGLGRAIKQIWNGEQQEW